MTGALSLGAAVCAVVGALWAALLVLASEADAGLPRIFAGRVGAERGELPAPRRYYLAHLALLFLTGAVAASATRWWDYPAGTGFVRAVVATLLVWVVADALPRLLATLAPELATALLPVAARTLLPFRPLLALATQVERRAAPPAAPREPRSREMLVGLFGLSNTTIEDVMTPRIDVVAVDTGAPAEEVVATFRQAEHARLLVYDGHPDAVVGALYAKDLLARMAASGDAGGWPELIRPVPFVPEGKTLDRQLRDFQRGPSHIAVVVDEFGGTAGIVTLEDILEQVVGEIQDEHDTDEAEPIVATAAGEWVVQGGTPLAELEAVLDHSFGWDDVSTVGGLVLAAAGHVPRAGEVVPLGPFALVAEVVARRRVRRVRVKRASLAVPPAEGQE